MLDAHLAQSASLLVAQAAHELREVSDLEDLQRARAVRPAGRVPGLGP
jgi:hypothetical protein